MEGGGGGGGGGGCIDSCMHAQPLMKLSSLKIRYKICDEDLQIKMKWLCSCLHYFDVIVIVVLCLRRLKVKTKAMDTILSLIAPAFEKLKKFLEEVIIIL